MTKYFYDLHIHSCLSPCADDDMTPNNIAGMAAIKGLNIVALTDHNSCKNCPAFFDACRRQGLIPIAGMELTTAEDIHIVCLFPELDDAMAFDKEIEAHLSNIRNRADIFGNQLILDGDDNIVGEEERLLISATDLWMEDALALVRAHNGYVHPAHINREANGIVSILGDIPDEYGFQYVEFKGKDDISEYKTRFGFITDEKILVCSDAHYLWDINEAENYLLIDDEPYSSSLVRRNFFELLKQM